MGKSRSSGTQTVTQELSPEERELVGTQADYLKRFYPRVEEAFDTAKTSYGASLDRLGGAEDASRAGTLEARGDFGLGSGAYGFGLEEQARVFGDDYLQNKLNVAQQEGRRNFQDRLTGLRSDYAAAGQPGSRRAAYAEGAAIRDAAAEDADRAARIIADVDDTRLKVAGDLTGTGERAIAERERLADKQVDLAGIPLDFASKYSGVLHGSPSVSPKFARTTTTTGANRGSEITGQGLGQTLLAGATLFSDKRLKSDIMLIGKIRDINIYSYYHNVYERFEIGVLAQEIKEIKPDAVSVDASGFLMVNYKELFEE